MLHQSTNHASISIFNSLSREKEVFAPLNTTVKMYSCGPTVYDFPHIGNIRSFVFSDLVHRTLLWAQYSVSFSMNITDVEDKIIAKSIEKNLSITQFCAPFLKSFLEDLHTMRILPASSYPKATEHIPEMIQIIQSLLQKGVAYIENGSVYFDINQFASYGKFIRLEDFVFSPPSDRDEPELAKNAVSDFVLWKTHKKTDGDAVWESPWGSGRPGWHIECSAMCQKQLGSPIDIHTGGIDNKFPHHENEIAQTQAAFDNPLANYWLHCEHLFVDGRKMSKSIGNFFTLRDLLKKGFSPMSIRYIFLTSHYRKPLNFSLENCRNAEKPIQALQNFAKMIWQEISPDPQDVSPSDPYLSPYWEKLVSGFCSDFNSAMALAALHELVRDYQADISHCKKKTKLEIWSFLKQADQVLGILELDSVDQPLNSHRESVSAHIQDLVLQREQARENKSWELADSLREKIEQHGYHVLDTPLGTRLLK